METFMVALDALIHSAAELSSEWELNEVSRSDDLSKDYPLSMDFTFFVRLLFEWRERLIESNSSV